MVQSFGQCAKQEMKENLELKRDEVTRRLIYTKGLIKSFMPRMGGLVFNLHT